MNDLQREILDSFVNEVITERKGVGYLQRLDHTLKQIEEAAWCDDMSKAPRDGTEMLGYSRRKGYGRFSWQAVDWDEHPLGKTHYWWSGVDDEMWIEVPEDVPTHWRLITLPGKV